MTATGHRPETPVLPDAPQQPRRVGARTAAVVRICMGLYFLWAFADKLFGLGYATAPGKSWLDGNSPTKGFLSNLDHGPFAETLKGVAGQGWADVLFMVGLLGIGVALLAGAGLRIAAATGSLLLFMMWVAEWPLDRFNDAGEATRSTNPLLDSHVVYALVLVLLAVLAAGNTWGVGKIWTRIPFVRENRWLH